MNFNIKISLNSSLEAVFGPEVFIYLYKSK